jgi:hypothetical protein
MGFRRVLPTAVVTALVLLLPSGTSHSQTVTGNLEGRAVGADGQPVAATVEVSGPALQAPRAVRADANGQFRVLSLPPGRYEVRLEQVGFAPEMLSRAVVLLGRTTSLGDIRLTPLAVREEIEVVAERPLIDPSSTSVGGTLTEKFFVNLPLERDYQSIVTLVPNVNSSYLGDPVNFAGSTGLENRYYFDGAEVSDPFRAVGGMKLPYNFVDELEVKSGGYEAEWRSSLGGIVNAITSSGGNRFAGSVFGFYASDRFAGGLQQGPVELKRQDYSQYDAGFSLGGPIIRDKLWFFGAYDPWFEQFEAQIPGLGFYPDKTRRQSFAAKLTWQAAPSTNVVLTGVGDPTKRDAVGDTYFSFGTPVSFANPDPYLREVTSGGYALSLRGTSLVGQKGLLEVGASYLSGTLKNLPSTPAGAGMLVVDAATGQWSGGLGLSAENDTSQWTGTAKLTWPLGSHELKAGVEYRDSRLDARLYSEGLEVHPDYWLLSPWRIAGTVHTRVPSVFIQDSWQATERLTVNVGLRWEQEAIVGSDGKVAQYLTGEWQPRLGFVFQPGDPGSQRISGSAGRFYQSVPLYPLTLYFVDGAVFAFGYFDHDPRLDPTGGDWVTSTGKIQEEIAGLSGQYYDEFTLGYERRLGQSHLAGIRGIYRTLGRSLEDGYTTAGDIFVWGNPGYGPLAADYPKAKREYTALELTLQGRAGPRLSYLASYVWSKTTGNYPGLFNSDFGYLGPNANGSFDVPEALENGDGRLPNDRPNVFKLSGSYAFSFGLTAGTAFFWGSGTPLSEFGGTTWGSPFYGFITQRGTAGRTPSIFDWSVRLSYDLPLQLGKSGRIKLIVDGFHLFSQKTPVQYEQVHYYSLDANGNQTDPNPLYGQPLKFLPPTSFRFGLQFDF